MKSHYYRFLILAAVALLTGLSMNAQSAWRQNTPSAKAENPAARADAAEGTIYLGHCNYDDYIYPWDGLSLDYDARVGVAIKLPRDMFKTYIGGKVTALRLGWDDSELTGTFDMFIRTSFDGEDLATGHGTGKFGWNELELDAPFEIPDTDELVVGYYTDLMAKVAPMMGLVCTLVPLGPGIVAMGQGDMNTLSSSLGVAFDGTVAGLVSAMVAMCVSHVRKRWYSSYQAAVEALMTAVLEKAEASREAGEQLPSGFTAAQLEPFKAASNAALKAAGRAKAGAAAGGEQAREGEQR